MVRFIEMDPKTGGMKARVGECALMAVLSTPTVPLDVSVRVDGN